MWHTGGREMHAGFCSKARRKGRLEGLREEQRILKLVLMEYYYRAQWIYVAVVSTVLTLRVQYNGLRKRCHAVKAEGLEIKPSRILNLGF